MKPRFWDRVFHISVWFSFNLSVPYWASLSPYTHNCICSFQYHSVQYFQSKHLFFFLQRKADQFSHGVRGRTFKEVSAWLFATPWTESMGFLRQSTGVDCHFLLQGLKYVVDLQCYIKISAVLQSDSVIYIYSFHILFHCDVSQDTEYSPLCCTIESCCLNLILFIKWFAFASHRLPIYPCPNPLHPDSHGSILCVCESVSLL